MKSEGTQTLIGKRYFRELLYKERDAQKGPMNYIILIKMCL